MSEQPIAAIILDFDETLADSSYGRLEAMRVTVQEHLGRSITAVDAAAVIYRFSTLEDQMLSFASDSVTATRMVRTFREHNYGEKLWPPALFPGIREAMIHLLQTALRLGLVTSRYRFRERRMAHLGRAARAGAP